MPQQQPTALDDSGNPIYDALDDSGNPIQSAPQEVIEPEQPQPSLGRKVWDWGNTSVVGAKEPTPEEWAGPNAGPEMMRQAAWAQATTPFAIAGEALGGIGLIRGVKALRAGRAGRLGTVAAATAKAAPVASEAEQLAAQALKNVPTSVSSIGDVKVSSALPKASKFNPLSARANPSWSLDKLNALKEQAKAVNLNPYQYKTADEVVSALDQLKQAGKVGGVQPTAPIPAPLYPPLPRELAGAKPNYSAGFNRYNLAFDNDMDKALYIIAQNTPSASDAKYLGYVMDNLGVDAPTARLLGKEVKRLIRENVKGKPAGQVTMPKLWNPKAEAPPLTQVPAVPPPLGNAPPGGNVPPTGPPPPPAGSPPPPGQPPVPPPLTNAGTFISENDLPFGQALREGIKEEGYATTIGGLMRGSAASGDLGPMFRQGMAYAGRPAWFKGLRQQFISFASEGGHQNYLQTMKADPMLEWAKTAKLDIPNINMAEEEIKQGGELAEKLLAQGLQAVPKPLRINFIRASNRAYSDSMGKLRFEAAKVLYKNYKRTYEGMIKTAASELDPKKALADAEMFNPDNPVVAERIGDVVNTASGRGSLKISKFHDLTASSRTINAIAFSPRLLSARLRTINRTLNPYNYAKVDPVLRKEYLKQLISIAGATLASEQMYSLFGAEDQERDPRSSKFGKSQFGNISVDNTGGYGKLATFGARTGPEFMGGGYIKDKNEQMRKLGEGVIGDEVAQLGGLMEGLTSPAVQLAFRMWTQKEFEGGKTNFTTMNPMENSAMKAIIPIIYQDIYEIYNEDPSMLPLIVPAALGQSINVLKETGYEEDFPE